MKFCVALGENFEKRGRMLLVPSFGDHFDFHLENIWPDPAAVMVDLTDARTRHKQAVEVHETGKPGFCIKVRNGAMEMKQAHSKVCSAMLVVLTIRQRL